MTILKKGVRFISQDTGNPMLEDEVPFIIKNLTPKGMRCAAILGFVHLQRQGYTLNKALEILGETPKEQTK
jgi:hypothetical protein